VSPKVIERNGDLPLRVGLGYAWTGNGRAMNERMYTNLTVMQTFGRKDWYFDTGGGSGYGMGWG
jgi:hypothetical protein